MVALLAIFVAIPATAQKYTLNDIGRYNMRNAGGIVEGNVIKGYYMFYESEKIDRKNRAFEILVLDENLKEKVSERIIEPKTTFLLEASYNGTGILFKFYDSKSGMVTYRIIDNAGKLGSKQSRAASKLEVSIYNNSLSKDLTNLNVNPFGKDMFVDVYDFKDKKGYSYQVDGLDNTGKTLWSYNPEHVKGVDKADYLIANDKSVLLLTQNAKNMTTRDYHFGLVSLGSDGGINFEIPLENAKYNMLAHNAYFEGENIVVIGEYYDIDDKAMKAESKGIFAKVIKASSGDDVSESFISWDKDILNKVSAENKKEIKNYSLFFHNIVKSSNGHILAIGEQYRKQVSAGGLAMKAVMGSQNTDASALEIKIGNIVVIELNSDFTLSDVTIVEKKPNRVILNQSYSLVNQHVLAKLLKYDGSFDYTYTQNSADNSLITMSYIDMEKVEGKGSKKAVFNTINYLGSDGKYSSDKLVLSTDAYSIRALAAKSGYVLIEEYFRKDKRVAYRLEPINL